MFGRSLPVPAACSGTARFSFAELCAKPLGAADYIAVSRAFHTVFITDVPAFSMQVTERATRPQTLARPVALLSRSCAHICQVVFGRGHNPENEALSAQRKNWRQEGVVSMLEGIKSTIMHAQAIALARTRLPNLGFIVKTAG
eukprot:scaffold665198_cov108-Prasinocladus_malaysianus.AAC.1